MRGSCHRYVIKITEIMGKCLNIVTAMILDIKMNYGSLVDGVKKGINSLKHWKIFCMTGIY